MEIPCSKCISFAICKSNHIRKTSAGKRLKLTIYGCIIISNTLDRCSNIEIMKFTDKLLETFDCEYPK